MAALRPMFEAGYKATECGVLVHPPNVATLRPRFEAVSKAHECRVSMDPYMWLL